MENEQQTQIETIIQGDTLQHGLSKIIKEEHRDLIQWFFFFMSEKKLVGSTSCKRSQCEYINAFAYF